MNIDDIRRMAREAGLQPYYDAQAPAIERFAALVAAAEREACIEACEASYHWINGPEGWLQYAVEAIQSRGNK